MDTDRRCFGRDYVLFKTRKHLHENFQQTYFRNVLYLYVSKGAAVYGNFIKSQNQIKN